jgi:hypothetical protein
MVVHGGIRESQNLGRQAQVLENDTHQLDRTAIQIECSKHDFVGVIAEGRNALGMENALNADLQLFFTRKALGGSEF